MKKTKVVLRGTNQYWFHEGLIAIIKRRTNWDEERVKEFIKKNEVVCFEDLEPSSATRLLEELESAGFEQRVEEGKGELRVILALPYETELCEIKKEFGLLSSRISKLEQMEGGSTSKAILRDSHAYQHLLTQQSEEKEPVQSFASTKIASERKRLPKESMSESAIGKYWLSRIGVFTLVLGIVFFIGYTFQYVGAWGKILVGAAAGSLLVGVGNYLASKENYRRWSMTTIGGGWAILYFTVFAAYHIPVAKVIFNPYLALAGLLLVAAGSIGQSLRYKSPVLVFFSYFLAFVAISTGEVSLHTLLASLLLGISIVVVTKKLGWNWLALFGLVAIYLIHWGWLEPSIYGYGMKEGFAGEERITEALLLPWAGNEWRIYPLITWTKSLLHQAFLIFYWSLFTTIGFFRKQEKGHGELLSFMLITLNSLVFTMSYIHHLHVYYPNLKYLFAFVMATIFLFLSYAEKNLNKGLLSDCYLAFSVSLFALTIPMYFDGPWITYGWSAGSAILAWLGVRHNRLVLERTGYVLAILVAGRLVFYDYLERDVLFQVWLPARVSLFLFAVASVALFSLYISYRKSRTLAEKEMRVAANSCLIASFAALGCGLLIGGFRAVTSPILIYEAVILMILGVLTDSQSLRLASSIFVGLAAIRVVEVDYKLELLGMFSNTKVAFRLAGAAIGVIGLLGLAEWLRRKKEVCAIGGFFPFISFVGALLLMFFFYDKGISPSISIIWGIFAFASILFGFILKERVYRWIGLGLFAFVVLRLFLHDFGRLETIHRIISFTGLGAVLIIASLIYSYYSKQLLDSEGK